MRINSRHSTICFDKEPSNVFKIMPRNCVVVKLNINLVVWTLNDNGFEDVSLTNCN